MNKTVNINLSGFFYHIDEDAYQKLQNYLKAIKRSFAGSAGEDEIIADIESRIAELFSEKMQNEKQVISMNIVDEVIQIMGQPEDYMVDEDIFEDEPKKQARKEKTSSSKKLFRDTDNKYIGGVASGFGHYFGIDALWIRLLLVLSVFLGFGAPIFIYIILWIFVPEAVTTTEKLQMRGEPINISNIEKKIKEGIDDVTETVKSVDYEKYGRKTRSGISSFFEGLGNVFTTLFKIFGKFIGVLLIIIGISSLIGWLIACFSFGTIDVFNLPFDGDTPFNYLSNDSGIPLWVVAIFSFFAVGIPFFFLIYLGFRILVKNFRSMSNYAKFSLFGLWLISIIVLTVCGIRQGASYKNRATVVKTEELAIFPQDTLQLKMVGNKSFSKSIRRDYDLEIEYDENDQKRIFSRGIRLIVRSTEDSIATIKVEKSARGTTHEEARDRAKAIDYNYSLDNNTLNLDSYFLTSPEQKFKSQQITIILYLPEGTTLFADENTYTYHRNNSNYDDILENGQEEHYLRVLHNKLECLDCKTTRFEYEDDNDFGDHFIIDGDGFNITIDGDEKIIIDENGLKIDIDEDDENFKMIIDENGVEIKSTDSKDGRVKVKRLKAGEDGVKIKKEITTKDGVTVEKTIKTIKD